MQLKRIAWTSCISMVTQLGVIWWLPSRCLSPTQEAGLGPKVGLDSGSWIRMGNTGNGTEGSRRNDEWLHKSTSNTITRCLTSWGGREGTTKITSLSSGGAVGGAISNQGRIRDKRKAENMTRTHNHVPIKHRKFKKNPRIGAESCVFGVYCLIKQ